MVKVGEKQEVVVLVGTELEGAMPESRKWWPKWVRNWKWQSKWVQNLKCPCAKMENGGQSG